MRIRSVESENEKYNKPLKIVHCLLFIDVCAS